MAKRISPTPSGTVEGGSVYPLAAQVEYEQKVQPVTIVSSLDTKGKQQPFTVAPDVNVINSFDGQDGLVILGNNAIGTTDAIDMSLYDSLIIYPLSSAPLVPNTIEIDIVGRGQVMAEDGTLLGMATDTRPQISASQTNGLLFTDILNDPDTTPSSDSGAALQYKITGLHGLLIAVAIKNTTGGTISISCYHKQVGFKGA